MNLIVAVDNNWAIGKDNKLLVNIPNDLRYFKEHTTNKVIVMGRKTLESFPQAKPLPNRTNIVITRNKDYKVKGATIVNSIEEVIEEIKKYKTDEVYIIGGQTIYEQFLDYCDVAYVTRINYAYDADAFFSNLDASKDWELVDTSEEHTYYDIEYVFTKYINKNVKSLY
ncbi:MAG: dihydrofolate reductase [Clostridiales bacterium]|nr:dihydrofolate reductase [Clostridiales bacterium]